MKTLILSAIISGIFVGVVGWASPAHAETYSWQSCVDLASKQNADLKLRKDS